MPSPRRNFDEVLPLLVSTYTQGRLVPFLGAGMSAGCLTLWDDFVNNLEAAAKTGDGRARKWSNDVRAQTACTKIRNSRGSACLLDEIRRALNPNGIIGAVPPQTQRLSEIQWPLVVSTNYDDLFFGACRPVHPAPANLDVRVLGRSPKDCKTVLSSLEGPFDRQYIWHIQGFLGGQFGNGIEKEVPALQDLQDQLVIGHEEYRAVANASPHFRQCFAQVFERRSFLFLGSSLTEAYFLNLFGEILELCGPSQIPHFALAKARTVDTHFLAEEMNITVCEFADFAELPELLERLKLALAMPHARATSWSFAVESKCGKKGDLQIVREDAPSRPRDHETIAFVASRDHETNLPHLPERYAWLSERHQPPRLVGVHTVQYGDTEMYALTARCRGDEDDSAVDAAMIEFLRHISGSTSDDEQRRVVHLQLSPSGGTVPPVFAFMKVIRAFGKWVREQHSDKTPFCLVLHIQDEAGFNLTSGRIDVQELLTFELIRFSAIVSPGAGKEPVRRVLTYKEGAKLEDVLDDLGIPFGKGSAEWSVSICPAPRLHLEKAVKKTTWTLADSEPPTLLSIGVVFGSVLTLQCEAANCQASAVGR